MTDINFRVQLMAVEHTIVEVGESSQSTLMNHLKTTTGTIVSV